MPVQLNIWTDMQILWNNDDCIRCVSLSCFVVWHIHFLMPITHLISPGVTGKENYVTLSFTVYTRVYYTYNVTLFTYKVQGARRINSEHNVLHISTQVKHLNESSQHRTISNAMLICKNKRCWEWEVCLPWSVCTQGILNHFPLPTLAVLNTWTATCK
jgi:hypothetical protein